MMKNSLPMEPGFLGFVSDPFNLSARATRPFLRVVFILLLAALASCSSSKKLKQSHTEKETSVDRTERNTATVSNITTTEKVDTTVTIVADTTSISYYAPWIEGDTATSYQEAETPTGKIMVTIKPVVKDGKRVSSKVDVTAIKKADSITVKVEKKTVANIKEQTKTKNDIKTAKEVKDSSKQVARKGFRLTGILGVVCILIFFLLLIYYYLKKKKIIP